VIRISVVGGGSASEHEREQAREVGRRLAAAGAVVLCGGLGGVMEAACEGARTAGGLTVGILPGLDAAAANPWVELPIVTGIGEARNVLVALSAQAVIAVGGELGTLSEIALARKHRIPVVTLGSWTLQERPEIARGLHPVESPEEAVDAALRLARRG
jgi:hypothetical protein